MSKDKEKIESEQLKFNTYCIFTEEKHDINEIIGLIFKDYIENLKFQGNDYKKN